MVITEYGMMAEYNWKKNIKELIKAWLKYIKRYQEMLKKREAGKYVLPWNEKSRGGGGKGVC